MNEIVHISVYAGLTMEMFRKYKGMNKFKSYMRGRISKILQKKIINKTVSNNSQFSCL